MNVRPHALVYAKDGDGGRLPVIDVTHPAFAVRLTETELQGRLAAHHEEEQRRARLPRWVQRAAFWVFARKSRFAHSLRQGAGGFLPGMATYRFKLGPDQLDAGWDGPIDRKIAASLPALCMRLRLQDMAELLAGHLAPRLAANPGRPLHFVNIAGGPCMDSLNALILLQQTHAGGLRGRPVQISVYDQDDRGPAFAANALAALQGDGAPLAGVGATLTHIPYRWDNPAQLREHLSQQPRDVIAVASSEGGLFDYGTDEEIRGNLEVLRDCLPPDTAMAGSLTPPKPADAPKPIGPRFAIRERPVDALAQVAARAQWRVEKAVARPFQTTVLLAR